MTLAELRALALATGFADPSTAAAIAMAESQGNPSIAHIVTNPAPGNLPERSFGLWQINTLAHPTYNETSLLDPTYNAQAAYAISSGGRNWSQWSTFTDRTYAQYMPGASGAAHAGIGLVAVAVLGGALVARRRRAAPLF